MVSSSWRRRKTSARSVRGRLADLLVVGDGAGRTPQRRRTPVGLVVKPCPSALVATECLQLVGRELCFDRPAIASRCARYRRDEDTARTERPRCPARRRTVSACRWIPDQAPPSRTRINQRQPLRSPGKRPPRRGPGIRDREKPRRQPAAPQHRAHVPGHAASLAVPVVAKARRRPRATFQHSCNPPVIGAESTGPSRRCNGSSRHPATRSGSRHAQGTGLESRALSRSGCQSAAIDLAASTACV